MLHIHNKSGKQIIATAKDLERNRTTTNDKRNSKQQNPLRKSKSLTTEKTNLMVDITLKRRSTGCITRQSSFYTTSNNNNHTKEVWRPPGFYEIPNVFGSDCFLKPEPYNSKNTFCLREYPSTNNKSSEKRRWYPVGPTHEIPQLPPLIRSENQFERKIRKALSHQQITVSTLDPRNKYTNFKEVGTGVNGSVVRVVHKYKKNVQLAIKRCRLDPDHEYKAAIVRELRIMASGHTNLIRLREVTLWRDDIWIAMDLQRCSVFAILCQRGLPEEHTIYITCETLKALHFLHSKAFIHRDIKCENLLLGWNGEVKLADFGLATRTTKRNRDRLGTSKWMAPEVIREEYYDEKIDMWSLGITIIEMMDRVPPHYLIKDEYELFTTVLNEPSPTFTYSYPTMYMRGLVAWLLDEVPATRPSAKDVLSEIDAHVQSKLLKCSSATELTRFMNHVLP
ncbi:kinase-like domain-containing protein [Cokeromyces recurvatus]|uniref:kinase-like domain-containing protein n=1 Tax=Cokeromyces recurvatus TaxID=90255 RepID=UPI0022206ED3|nr:kinase-like domain-containing protein [Cokeromyces recurvatus]KAI7899027.1 kinase-like domain-containing protein [Cokeromyces recurvatus]